jgi:hypothetical protein
MRQWLTEPEQDNFGILIDEVVRKSQGVFLWVILVVHSLQEGLTNGDSVAMLEHRVEDFPADLEPFFEQLIQSVEPLYRNIMAKTFLVHLVPRAPSLPLMLHSFLEEEWDFPLKLSFFNDRFSDEAITANLVKMRRRISGRYKGLLEVVCFGSDPERADRYYSTVVQFLHRSIRDFLETHALQSMLYSYVDDGFSAELQLCRIYLVQMKTLDTPPLEFSAILNHTLYCSKQYQLRTGLCDYELLDQLRQILKSQDKRGICIDSDAKYLGLLVLHGLSAYAQEYIRRNPNCGTAWSDFSPVLLLLDRDKWWQDCVSGATINHFDYDHDYTQNPEEVAQLVKMFLHAGLNPSNDRPDTSTWVYLVSILTVNEPDWIVHYNLSVLLDLCLDHGATFSDLIVGEEGREWAQSFVYLLNRGRWFCALLHPIEFLKKLFAHRLDPMHRHESLENASLWSLILDDVLLDDWSGTEERDAATDVIELCLAHGADSYDSRLLDILDTGRFTANGTQKIRKSVQGSQRKTDRQKRKKRKRQTAEDQGRNGNTEKSKKKRKRKQAKD